jgi:hypothetical protein
MACPPLAPGATGLSPDRVEEPGGRWAGRGFGPCEPLPPVDHPPHGEGAPYLRDG